MKGLIWQIKHRINCEASLVRDCADAGIEKVLKPLGIVEHAAFDD